FQESGSPENSPLLSRLQRRQEKSGGVINTRQLHRHYQSTQATTARLTQRLTLPEQINSRYGASGLQPKLNMERFSRPRVESADVSNTYLEPTNLAPSNVALSGRGEGVQRSMATRTNSPQFPSNLGHQGRSQPPSRSVPSTSPKVPIISQIKSSTVPRSSAQPPISLPRQVKINRQATLSALHHQFTPPESVQSQVVPPKTEGDSHSPSPVTPASVVQTKLVVAKANQSLATGKTSSTPDLVWRSQEEEESDSSLVQTKLSNSNPNQDISLVQTKSVVVKPSQPLPTTTITPTKTTNLTKDTAINNSADNLVWRSQEEEESDSSLGQTKLSDSNPNQDISLLQTKPVVVKPSQPLPTTTITPNPNINLTTEKGKTSSKPDLVWRSQEEEESDSSLVQTKLSDSNHNQDISLVQTKSVVVKPSQPSPTTTTTPTKTTNLTKDTAINNSATDFIWRSQEEEESDSSLVQTKLSYSNPNHDISLVQTKSVVIKPSQPSPTTTTTPNRNINLDTETGKTSSTPDLVWRKTDNESVAKVSKLQQLSASQHNQSTVLPLATQPVRSDGVIARQPNLTGANSIPMTAPVTSTTAASNLPTTPAPGVNIDIEAIAEHVSRILTRQLTMEQERRGIEKWH
ncbi:MAG: hypothetical protein F6K26_39895, partial [Moorea sp. SIO2I5]|nr:hypothetical protein [Moorena sp. SIO2I5]